MCWGLAEGPIHLALLLPMTAAEGDWAGGPHIAGAAVLAIEKINNSADMLLTRRVLEYSWKDSGCSAKQALNAIGQIMKAEKQIDAGTSQFWIKNQHPWKQTQSHIDHEMFEQKKVHTIQM